MTAIRKYDKWCITTNQRRGYRSKNKILQWYQQIIYDVDLQNITVWAHKNMGYTYAKAHKFANRALQEEMELI